MSIPVVDLFAGPGGLGEGFAAARRAGLEDPGFQVVLSYEKDDYAVRTLRFRELYRTCSFEGRLNQYLHGIAKCASQWHEAESLLVDELKDVYSECSGRVRHVALGPDVRETVAAEVRNAVSSRPWVLVGGPPCQAYSLVGRARNRGNPEYNPREDDRHYLYGEYLSLLAAGRPEVFVLENVKGLLSASIENQWIFGRMLADLSNPGAAVRRGPVDDGRPSYRLYSLVTGAELRLSEVPQLSLDGSSEGVTYGADVKSTIVRMEDYGAPQARHRVIILGIRSDLVDRHRVTVNPLAKRKAAAVADVIADLPALRSRLSDTPDGADAWRSFTRSVPLKRWLNRFPQAEYAQLNASPDVVQRAVRQATVPYADAGATYLPGSVRGRRSAAWLCRTQPAYLSSGWRKWYRGDLRNGFGYLNHESRGHMRDDLRRYIFAASYAWVTGSASPRLRDFPSELYPKHRNLERAITDNHFADRFRVQLAFRPSSTITSHIHKDGHYYIHFDPTQARSLTVREAARLQTFPDSYAFLGPRTEQYRQVGNAVPPFVAAQVAEVVFDILSQAGLA